MIKTLTILYLLGATCFSSALPTDGQSIIGRQQLLSAQSKNQQTKASWQSIDTQNGNLQENGQLSRSQESENEINDNENPGAGGEESAPASEDKQFPAQPAHQQQQQPKPDPNAASQSNSNKRPVANQQQVQPLPYATIYSNGNHPPGMIPMTQYSSIQIMGYQKEQTGQSPINHQQQMIYSGGSNSIPMIIYSDSERPPITMFYLGQGDKQMQGNLRTGDFMPNLQPINPQPMSTQPIFYYQPQLPYNMPMPFYDSVSQSPVNSWDRQYPIYETYSSSQYYPSNIPMMKNKEIQKPNRVTPQKSLKQKAAEFGSMGFVNEQMERPAWTMPMSEKMFIQKKNTFNPKAMDQQLIAPWMMPQKQRLAKMETMRSVMNPFWGIEPKQAYEWNESMERSNSNNDISMLRSRYSSLPTSPYTLGRYSSENEGQYISGLSSYASNGEQQSNSGQSSSVRSSLPHSSNAGGQHSSSGYSIVPSSSFYSTSPGQRSSLNQGANNSNKKQQNQFGISQGSTSYRSPSSSHISAGSSYGQYTSGIREPELLGSQQQAQKQRNTQASLSGTQSGLNKFEQGNPVIAIVPLGLMMESQNGMSNNQRLPGTDQSQLLSAKSFSAFSPKDAVLGSPQWGLSGGLGGLGLGGNGYGNTGLNNQYSSANNAHLANQNAGASNNQQFGHENFNTLFSQPLPSGGQIYTQVNSDKGFSGGSYGQGSQAVGLNDQNFNSGGLSSNQGYNNALGGYSGGILPSAGLGYGTGINLG